MTPVAHEHKRSQEILHGMNIRRASDKGPTVIYGPTTYVDKVYGARNGGRPHPSQINKLRAADVVKQHLGFGPAPTFKTLEQKDQSNRNPIELKIPKQRKRAHANATSGQTDSEAWKTARKKATQKLKEPVLGRARQTPRRTSACFVGTERSAHPAVGNEKTQRNLEKRGVGIEAQRSDGSRHTSIGQDERPRSISEELYEAFMSQPAENFALAIGINPATSPSNTDSSLSPVKPKIPTNSTVHGSAASSKHRNFGSTTSSLHRSINEDAPESTRKRRRRICSNDFTAPLHLEPDSTSEESAALPEDDFQYGPTED